MSHFTFKNVDLTTIKRIEQDLAPYQVHSNNPHVRLAYKPNPNLTVYIFKNTTVLLQGEVNELFIKKYSLQTTTNTIEEPPTVLPRFNDFNVLGCDEVGVGDFFGPIVTCCAYVSTQWIATNQELVAEIQDSKKLSNEKIFELFDELQDNIKYSVYIMGNKTYNENYEKYQNLNTLKVIAHNQALHNFAQANSGLALDYVLMDQFVAKNLYYKHIYSNNINRAPFEIFFTTKAEDKSIAVACASIIARYYFLTAIKKIENELGFSVLLGANTAVKKLVLQVKENQNIDESLYIKLNFNTNF